MSAGDVVRGLETVVLRAADDAGRADAILRAAEILRAGGLVAFPTETVYGLGAIASNALQVQRIFDVKQRPSGVPLIVHVTGVDLAERYVTRMTAAARLLADHFWPGPLTLVLPRAANVPRVVAGGGETVAVRAPAHAVALALIQAVGEGIAAPSANRYNDLPPVRSEHVEKGLGGSIECVLDGGRCPGGLESTVVDLTCAPARVVRRGAVPIEALRAWIEVQDAGAGTRAALTIEGAWLSVREPGRIAAMVPGAERVGVLLRTVDERLFAGSGVLARTLADDAREYGAEMYDALHALREAQCARVIVESLPDDAAWDAMRDRLARLAEQARPIG